MRKQDGIAGEQFSMAREPFRIVRGTSGIVQERRPIDDGSRGVVGETSSNVAAREGSKVALLRSKRSSRDFVANDSGSCPVRFRPFTSHEELETCSPRSERSGRDSRSHSLESRLFAVNRRRTAHESRLSFHDAARAAHDSTTTTGEGSQADDESRQAAQCSRRAARDSRSRAYSYMVTCRNCRSSAQCTLPRPLPVPLRLQREHLRVLPPPRHELVVRPSLDDAAVVQHDDVSRHAHRREAV